MKLQKQFISKITALVLVSILVQACSRQQKESFPKDQAAITQKHIDGHAERMAILELPSTAQKVVFEQKTGPVKVAIWQDKLNQVISHGGWNASQLAYIDQARIQLHAELWTTGSVQETDFMTRFHDSWVSNAKQAFDENQLGWIIATLDDYTPSGPVTNPDVDDCDCSFSSDWCPGSSYCQGSNCGQTGHGCGMFWVYKCKGECSY